MPPVRHDIQTKGEYFNDLFLKQPIYSTAGAEEDSSWKFLKFFFDKVFVIV